MNEKFNVFIDKLIQNKKLRTEFAKDPKGVLAREGIELPKEMVPTKIEEAVLEERLNALNAFATQLQKPGLIGVDKFSLIAGGRIEKIGRGGPGIGPIATDSRGTIM
jgi:hypothetical protein